MIRRNAVRADRPTLPGGGTVQDALEKALGQFAAQLCLAAGATVYGTLKTADVAWGLGDLGVGLMAAGAAKLLWRRELGRVSYLRLALWAFAAGAAVLLGGLLLLGQDGRMVTYGTMVVACALALWWAGFLKQSR